MNTTAGLKVVSERLSAVWRAAWRSGEGERETRGFSFSPFFSGGCRLEGNRCRSSQGGEIAEARSRARPWFSSGRWCVSGWWWVDGCSTTIVATRAETRTSSERSGSINSTTFANRGGEGGQRTTRTSVTHEGGKKPTGKQKRINYDGT